MSDLAPKRRRLRWSLRTLFVAVAALGVSLGWAVREMQIVQARRDVIEYVQAEGGNVGAVVFTGTKSPSGEDLVAIRPLRPGARFLHPVGWFRRLLGDVPITWFWIPPDSAIDLERIHATFPDAGISVVDEP